MNGPSWTIIDLILPRSQLFSVHYFYIFVANCNPVTGLSSVQSSAHDMFMTIYNPTQTYPFLLSPQNFRHNTLCRNAPPAQPANKSQ